MDKRYEAPAARSALARAAGLLAVEDHSDRRHRPSSMSCSLCAGRWQETESLLTRPVDRDAVWVLGQLARLWSDGHRPGPGCSSCESCWMELDEASRGLVLAHCAVHPFVGWGPAHLAPHPARGRCSDCRAWIKARESAAERLSRAGFVPSDWLPPRSIASKITRLPAV